MIARSYCDETLPNSRRQTVEMSQASPSDMATRSLPPPPYFTQIVIFKFAHPHPLIILTKHVCDHNTFWEADVTTTMCALFLQNSYTSTAISASCFGYDNISSYQSRLHHLLLTTHFELFRPNFLLIFPFRLTPIKINHSRLLTQLFQIFSNTVKSVQSALSDLKRPPERLQSQCNYRLFIT